MLRRVVFLLLVLAFAPVDAQPSPRSLTLRWTLVAPGVWRATAGTPERISLLGAAGSKPSLDGLQRVGPAEFPLDRSGIVAQVVDGKLVRRFPLGAREQL